MKVTDLVLSVMQGFSDILTNPPIRAGKNIVHDILEQSFHAFEIRRIPLGSHTKKAGSAFCDKQVK